MKTLIVSGFTLAATVMLAGPAWAQGGVVRSDLGVWRILAAAGAALAVVLLGVLFTAGGAVERDIRGRLGSYGGASGEKKPGGLVRVPLLSRFAKGAEDAAERRGLLNAFTAMLEQADLPVTAGEALTGAFIVAVLGGGIAGLATASAVTGIFATLLLGAVVIGGMRLVADRERHKFENQLPDTLNLISSSLRAGYSLLQAVEAVSQEASEPTAREFRRTVTEIRLGQTVPQALQGIAARMGSIDFDWAVMAIDIQREVGGNLAEVLQTAAETMMYRNRLRRDIKALTAEGRISAIVLAAMPFLLFGFLWSSNRDYLQPLLDATVGRVAIGGALGLLAVGVLWLRKIVNIKV